MTGSRFTSLLSSLLFSAIAFCWTAAGETAAPQLATSELPADILNNDCADSPCAEVDYRTNGGGHTAQGELFVVGRAGGAPGSCTHWLVEKGAVPVRMLLELDGSFALQRSAGRYPSVEVRTRSDDKGIVYARFEWTGQQYTRTSARRVYEVNGVECGTRDECGAAAERALKGQKVDRALRIWQRVYGVSWI